jgi:hypothetical protein
LFLYTFGIFKVKNPLLHGMVERSAWAKGLFGVVKAYKVFKKAWRDLQQAFLHFKKLGEICGSPFYTSESLARFAATNFTL